MEAFYYEIMLTTNITAENILQDDYKIIRLIFCFFVVIWIWVNIYLDFVVLSCFYSFASISFFMSVFPILLTLTNSF